MTREEQKANYLIFHKTFPDIMDWILVEEMAELMQQLSKKRRGRDNLDQLVDEFTDVRNVLLQFQAWLEEKLEEDGVKDPAKYLEDRFNAVVNRTINKYVKNLVQKG